MLLVWSTCYMYNEWILKCSWLMIIETIRNFKKIIGNLYYIPISYLIHIKYWKQTPKMYLFKCFNFTLFKLITWTDFLNQEWLSHLYTGTKDDINLTEGFYSCILYFGERLFSVISLSNISSSSQRCSDIYH